MNAGTDRRGAPSAIRSPISLVRRATVNAITPYRPSAASTVASAPNTTDNDAMSRLVLSVSSSCLSNVFISYSGSDRSILAIARRNTGNIAIESIVVRT